MTCAKALIAAALLVSPVCATAQDVTLPTTPGEQVDHTKLLKLGASPSFVNQLNRLAAEARKLQLRSAGDPTGIGSRVVVTSDGQIKILTSPDAPPSTVVVPEGVLKNWIAHPQLNLVDQLKAWADSLIPKVGFGFDTQKSVPPDWVPAPGQLPPLAAAEAERNGWKAGVTAPHCSSAQNMFEPSIEKDLQLGHFVFKAPDQGTRARWIKVISDYDSACLTPVDPKSAAAVGLPLDRLAVVLDEDGTPICMALHLGGDDFITARHCFFDQNGASIAKRDRPLISMADVSAVLVKTTIQPNRPFPPTPSYNAAKDLVILVADGLPQAVRNRRLAGSDFAQSTVAEPALLIGYFPLANADQRLPADLSTGSAAPWNAGLRMTSDTEGAYCRVWDRSKSEGASGCLEHSCQSVGGFSGAPIFVKRNGQWRVVGLNVAGATTDEKTAASCGTFAFGSNGLLNFTGSIAAVVSSTTVSTEIASVAKGESRP